MRDPLDTGDLWPRARQVQRLYGISYSTVLDWAKRYDCAILVDREDDNGAKPGGKEYRFWRPALDYARARDTGAADDERKEMRILGQRFFEP
jgi:hypothetical protein